MGKIDHLKSKKQNGKGFTAPFPFCQQPPKRPFSITIAPVGVTSDTPYDTVPGRHLGLILISIQVNFPYYLPLKDYRKSNEIFPQFA